MEGGCSEHQQSAPSRPKLLQGHGTTSTQALYKLKINFLFPIELRELHAYIY